MTGKELRKIINSGIIPLVEFTENINDMDCRFEKGMRAYITGVSEEDRSGCITVICEEKDLIDYNKKIETPDWFNPATENYDLKFSDTEWNKTYKGVVEYYEMEDEEICNFNIIDDGSLSLFNEYLKEYTGLTYVEWLEDIILKFK